MHKPQMLVTKDEAENEKKLADIRLSSEKRSNIEAGILEFFIKERLPLARMNSKHFNNLIDGQYIQLSFLCLFILTISNDVNHMEIIFQLT